MGWYVGWDVNARPAFVTPAMPASSATVVNNTGSDVMVYISAGLAAITGIAINGTTINGLTITASTLGHPIRLSVGSSITLTYTGSPSWQWIA